MTVFERFSGGCEQRRLVAIFSELLDQLWSKWIRW